MDSVPQKREFLVICSLLVLGTLLLYGRTIQHDFVNYDDQVYVTENSFVLQGFTVEGVKWAFISLDSGNWHPLTWLSHMLDVQLFGKSAGGHHLTSVLLHALNAVVLFCLLIKATRATWRSAFVSALFA